MKLSVLFLSLSLVTLSHAAKNDVIYTGLSFKPTITLVEFEKNKKNAKSCTPIKTIEYDSKNNSKRTDCVEWYDPYYFSE